MQSALRLATRTTAVSARAFSTSAAAKDGLVRPSVQLFGLEGRYAHALYSAASKSKTLTAVEKEVAVIKAKMASDAVFAEFLASPVLSRADKTTNIEKILSTWKMSDTTVNFFGAMAENNRLGDSAGIINAFDTLMASHRNEVTCTVISAAPLSKADLNSLTKSLKGFAAEGQSVNVGVKVDKSILGGLIVEIGDKYVDMSVKSKVQKMVRSLAQPV